MDKKEKKKTTITDKGKTSIFVLSNNVKVLSCIYERENEFSRFSERKAIVGQSKPN